VVGAENFSQANVRASLPELREGGAPNFQRLAVQTAIANESQSKQVQVVLKASAEPDKIDADINVKDSRPWNWSAALSNNGSAATGRDRLVLAGSHANVLDRDHQVDAAYTTSMAKPGDVRQYGLNYRIPLYALGGVLGFSHTHSDVSGNFASFSSSGAGQTLGLSYNLYLPPVGGYRSWVSAGLEDKQFDITQINGAPLPGQALRRSRPLSLRYSARLESDKALLTYDAELALNGPGGQGNSLADYQSEDPRIAVNRWKLLRANASYSASLGVGWLWSARAQLQYSADALISGEQFGLGGTSSVRGTEERPLSGDRGLSLGLEFSTPELQPGLRVVGFIDGGVLSNVVSNGTNKPNSDHLASAGLGLRYVAGKVSATADWGRVFVGSVVPTSVTNMAPQVGNQKMHVNITGRF
jgi:hemolysin activation/secretion protein